MQIRTKQMLRGAIGGVLGHILKSVFVLGYFIIKPESVGMYLFFIVPLYLFFGAISSFFAGAIIGYLAFWLSAKFNLELRVFHRIMVGIVATGSIWLAIQLLDKLVPETNRWSMDNISAWLFSTIVMYDMGLIIGIVSGIFGEGKPAEDLPNI